MHSAVDAAPLTAALRLTGEFPPDQTGGDNRYRFFVAGTGPGIVVTPFMLKKASCIAKWTIARARELSVGPR